ncbi:hypothetical protein TWF217_008526 [Orbilia oligospora]|nr:hypothetical protein TWF217_008526 [Orbilia oligospora]KAF3294830.1 hypothetical protein TWF132_002758 [Orbilia oligospora]
MHTKLGGKKKEVSLVSCCEGTLLLAREGCALRRVCHDACVWEPREATAAKSDNVLLSMAGEQNTNAKETLRKIRKIRKEKTRVTKPYREGKPAFLMELKATFCCSCVGGYITHITD